MPLWPVWPLIGLAGCVVVFTQQTLSDIGMCAIILAVAAVYYFAYLHPRRATHRVMLNPAHSNETRSVAADAAPQASPGSLQAGD